MRFVIMANGRGRRWGGYLGVPKHLIEVDGETLLRRIARQLSELAPGSDVVISASNPLYDTEGARRHAPLRNELELDRFAPELIVDGVCFLYGDTFYSDAALTQIATADVAELGFFGDERGIVAVRATDGAVLRAHLDRVRALFLAGEIDSCQGWQVYQSYRGVPLGAGRPCGGLTPLSAPVVGFNTPEEYEAFARTLSRLAVPA